MWLKVDENIRGATRISDAFIKVVIAKHIPQFTELWMWHSCCKDLHLKVIPALQQGQCRPRCSVKIGVRAHCSASPLLSTTFQCNPRPQLHNWSVVVKPQSGLTAVIFYTTILEIFLLSLLSISKMVKQSIV